MHGTEEDTAENIMVCQEGNMYNLLDENKNDWEEIVAIYKNKRKQGKLEQQKKYKRKRYRIIGRNNKMEKLNELTQTHREKT